MASLGQPLIGWLSTRTLSGLLGTRETSGPGWAFGWNSHTVAPGVLGSLYRHQEGVTGEEEETNVVKIQHKDSF